MALKDKLRNLVKKDKQLSEVDQQRVDRMKQVSDAMKQAAKEIQNERAQQNRHG